MDITVIGLLIALFAVAFAEDPDDDLTQIFQRWQEEEELQLNYVQQDPASDLIQILQRHQEKQNVQSNSVPQDPVSDLTQIFQSQHEEQQEVQPNSAEQDAASDLTQIFQSQHDEQQEVQPNSAEQDAASDLTQIFQSQHEERQEVQPNSTEQDAASDLTQIFQSEEVEEEAQKNFVKQESEAETAVDTPLCVLIVQRCVSPIATFMATDEDVCETMRSAYNCLKDLTASCLQGGDRESVQPRLNQIKSAMDANCVFVDDNLNVMSNHVRETTRQGWSEVSMDISTTTDNSNEAMEKQEEEKSEEQKCYDNTRIDLKECQYQGIMQTLPNFKTGENNVERFKCETYSAIAACQTDKIQEKCGEAAAEQFFIYVANLPDPIRQACEVANKQKESIFQDKRITRRRK